MRIFNRNGPGNYSRTRNNPAAELWRKRNYKMNEREKEQRIKSLNRNCGICPVCGGSIYQNGTPQYAHKIANTKANREKYGWYFIDHPLNGEMVCSLSCNQSMNIGMNKGKCLELLVDIILKEIKEFCK